MDGRVPVPCMPGQSQSLTSCTSWRRRSARTRRLGETVYRSDELTTRREDGRPDIDVKCRQCGYVGAETAFVRAARRDKQPSGLLVPLLQGPGA